MIYHVKVYVIKGVVDVEVDKASSKADAKIRAVEMVEEAEVSFHGNYPESDCKYLAIISENNKSEVD